MSAQAPITALRRILLSASALSLAACAGLPGAGAPPVTDAPARFTAETETQARTPTSDWVAAFGDAQLDALVAEALANNPDVDAARAALEAAAASARLSGAARLPSLDASLSQSRTDNDLTGVTTNSASLGLSAGWEADIWGRLTDQARAGALGREAAAADLAGARLSIAGATAQAWFTLKEAALQTQLAEFDVETRTRQLEITERRFARGVARSSDVRTARSARASSQAALASRRRIEAEAGRRLEILLGRYPADAVEAAAALPELAALPAAGTPEALLDRRPDVIAAEARLAASGFSARAARKALYPRLNLSASISQAGEDISDVFDTDALIERVAGDLLAPIFRGGALRAERDRAEADARRLAAAYVSTTLSAFQEAENAIYADAALADRVDALRVAQEEAAAALALVEREYARGVATIFELLDAQSRVISAESQLIAARRDRATNRVAFHVATAGGFSAGGGETAAAD